jgi:hypothetical protein
MTARSPRTCRSMTAMLAGTKDMANYRGYKGHNCYKGCKRHSRHNGHNGYNGYNGYNSCHSHRNEGLDRGRGCSGPREYRKDTVAGATAVGSEMVTVADTMDQRSAGRCSQTQCGDLAPSGDTAPRASARCPRRHQIRRAGPKRRQASMRGLGAMIAPLQAIWDAFGTPTLSARPPANSMSRATWKPTRVWLPVAPAPRVSMPSATTRQTRSRPSWRCR